MACEREKRTLSIFVPESKEEIKLSALHERVEVGCAHWWGAGGPSQMGGSLDDHCGIFDSRQKHQGKDALEYLGPTHANPC
ncbi:MAG: hypothetical protein NPIRA01_00290 [Nitrospirales bacterium]|nr:MAG: hypothetical protein NPIRA01_00290 [Nitrospirales bacterium]